MWIERKGVSTGGKSTTDGVAEVHGRKTVKKRARAHTKQIGCSSKTILTVRFAGEAAADVEDRHFVSALGRHVEDLPGVLQRHLVPRHVAAAAPDVERDADDRHTVVPGLLEQLAPPVTRRAELAREAALRPCKVHEEKEKKGRLMIIVTATTTESAGELDSGRSR